MIDFKVEADKGFFFSKFDDAFVCQKKNHFQVSVSLNISDIPFYYRIKNHQNIYKIEKFKLMVFGIKQEAPLEIIPIRESHSDRKPVKYEPIEFKYTKKECLKLTKKRLHFSQTTNNNNRKKNKPNPDQRYFYCIVQIEIVNNLGESHTLCSSSSERVIVRVRSENISIKYLKLMIVYFRL